MDPVTAAILAAVTAGLVSGTTKVGESAIADAYEGLKGLLKRKFGGESKVARAVEEVENNPDSGGRKLTLEEEVTAAEADKDPEILEAAKNLLDKIQAQPSGEQHVQQAIGNYIAQADRGSKAQVRINQPRE